LSQIVIPCVVFAEKETAVTLQGYAEAAPKVSVEPGKARAVQYNAATRHFTVEVKPDAGAPVDASDGDPVRHAIVILKTVE